MQKVSLGKSSSGNGWDETFFYLVFDEENAELYVERSWQNWSPTRGIDEGSENITLAELKKKRSDIYEKAVTIITASFPKEEDQN